MTQYDSERNEFFLLTAFWSVRRNDNFAVLSDVENPTFSLDEKHERKGKRGKEMNWDTFFLEITGV